MINMIVSIAEFMTEVAKIGFGVTTSVVSFSVI
jgi:hypothetical protein